MKDFRIRLARPDDAAALLKIYSPYVLNTAVSYEYEPPTLEEFRGRIMGTLEKYPYLVAENEGILLGYAYAAGLMVRKAGSWAVEVSIYIDGNQRRAGIGSALYAVLERLLKMQNIVSCNVCIAACDRENDEHLSTDSLKFHSRCGYVESGRHNNCGYKFGKWYSLVWMEKSLGERISPMPDFIPLPELLEKNEGLCL